MVESRMIKLGLMLHGVGRTWNDWRHSDRDVNASTSLTRYRDQAVLAERGKFDFLFVADSLSITEKSSPHYLSRFEPITILSALAAATSHIGLVGTLTVSYSEPFNVARQFASLDHISGGRAGWNIVTSWLSDTAANFGRAEHPPHHLRYRIAAEYLDVVEGLWDSWEEDAFVADKESGLFVDPEKLHRLDHQGEYFRVRGPLNLKRTPQGRPVIFQAGASEEGRDFAAKRSDAIFAVAATLEDGAEYRQDIRQRAKGFGRNPDELFVLPGIAPVIGETEAAARRKYAELAALESLETGIGLLSRMFNDHDFHQYDLDAPFPDVAHIGQNSLKSLSGRILSRVQSEKMTLRQVLEWLSEPRGGTFIGSPEGVADELQRWFENGAADGFVIVESLPGQLALFVEKVVPILQARGLFREDYEGDTFRGSLGLPVPENRYTAARKRRSAA